MNDSVFGSVILMPQLPTQQETTDPANDQSDRQRLSPYFCELCCREMKKKSTQHHLIPRTCHKNRWFQKNYTRQQMRETIQTCAECHRAIHRLIPREKDLGREYNTIELLLAHTEFAKFISWVRRQK